MPQPESMNSWRELRYVDCGCKLGRGAIGSYFVQTIYEHCRGVVHTRIERTNL